MTLIPGDANIETERTLVLDEGMLDGVTLNKNIAANVTTKDGQCRIVVRFKGTADLVTADN